MALPFTFYYVLKDSYSYLSSSIRTDLDLNQYDFFKYALFLDIPEYYTLLHPFKKDPYQLKQAFTSSKMPLFIKECLDIAKKNDNPNQQFFCYSLLLGYLFQKEMVLFVQQNPVKKKPAIETEKMIDAYFFEKNEQRSLSSVNIADYFFDSFSLSEEDIELLEKPMKRIFGFFCTENYFQQAYQQAATYFSYFTRSKTNLKKIGFVLYDLFFSHQKEKRKAVTFLYPKKIDTALLHLTQKNESIETVYANFLKTAATIADLINQYFVYDNPKPFLKYFQLTIKNKEL